MRPIHSTAEEPSDPTPDPSSTVIRSRGARDDDEPYEVWMVADERRAQGSAERLIGAPGGEDRERALVEAGRFYGRDHARRSRTARIRSVG